MSDRTSGNSVSTVKNLITIKGLDFSIMPDATRHASIFQPEPKMAIPTEVPSSTRSAEVDDFGTCPISGYGTTIVRSEYYSKLQKEQKCDLYDSYENFSKIFIDDILDGAAEHIRLTQKRDVIFGPKKFSVSQKPFVWPTIKEFGEKRIGFKIVQWIDSTADVTENWLYSVMMVSKTANHVSDFYKYEAIFSLPTKCYPISQATASVFFLIEVSRVMSEVCPVHVTFQLESFSTQLSPKTHVITDALLFRVIDAKIKVFKSFYF
ncbi:uncharacterized protein LOC114325366 isoform X1 [Diabrotica virgifera virgifera]|uniref:Uncharacterized protein LOC114325366 isoform X1 n=1 Tax=Diabrotica virgifera virgifera TaxID=50390 RepID=A0A6P7F626_DIAVI|nr:uncharacterized protein LOC114325366 isoform X1 [Diabrotica virgifera virgifera]